MENNEAERRLKNAIKAFYFIYMDNTFEKGWRELDTLLELRGVSSDDFTNDIMVEIEDKLKDYQLEIEVEDDDDLIALCYA